MVIGRTRQDTTGLIHYEPYQCDRGYTLFCGGKPRYAYLIDMNGKFCHRWSHPEGITHAKLLDNGNLLCRGEVVPMEDGKLGMAAQARIAFELDWESNVVWEFRDDNLHHDHERLPNGNTLLIAWRQMTEEQSALVKGGYPSDDDDPKMLGDIVLEVTPQGDVAREWHSWEHLDPDVEIICPLEYRREWTHCNSITTSPDGDWIVSMRRTDTIAFVDPISGAIKKRIGPGLVSHQHDAHILPNGHMMIFDNGVHSPKRPMYSRVIEIDIETQDIVWEYQADPVFSFFSVMAGSAQRLPNGNTLICHSSLGRFFEVTSRKEIVWEYINPFYTVNVRTGGKANISFRARRFGPDHPVLADKDLDPNRYANLNRLY